MNVIWRPDQPKIGWVAFDEHGREYVHVARRGPNNKYDLIAPFTRWCVFGHASYLDYAGDLPIELTDDEAKAAAFTLWRLSE